MWYVQKELTDFVTKLHVISYLEWGVDSPALWAADVGNSWRTTFDVRDNWNLMLSNIDIVGLSYTLRIYIFVSLHL